MPDCDCGACCDQCGHYDDCHSLTAATEPDDWRQAAYHDGYGTPTRTPTTRNAA